MICEVYNEHNLYKIKGISNVVQLLNKIVKIDYDEISAAFLTEKTICNLHKKFLKNPDPTDVITFPALKNNETKTGEICISVDEAIKHTYIQNLNSELLLYLVHGWLHLANYDDISEIDKKKMRIMEKIVIKFLNKNGIIGLNTKKLK